MKKTVSLFLCVMLTLSLSAQNVILGPRITQIEGQGNGGQFLYLSNAALDSIMAGAPWKVQNVEYANGCAPVQVKVIDPLQTHAEYDYRLKILPVTNDYDNSLISNEAHWQLEVLDNNNSVVETILSQSSIGEGVEEIIEGHGFSVKVMNHSFSVDTRAAKELYDYPHFSYSQNMMYARPDLLGATISYSGEHNWLSGVADEETNVKNNWIRAGNRELGRWNDSYSSQDAVENSYELRRQEDYFYLMPQQNNIKFRAYYDHSGQFERVLGGTWAPYPLASAYNGGPQAKYITPDNDPNNEPSPSYYDFRSLTSMPQTSGYNGTLTNLYSVDVVLTPDRSKWTRAIVLEACEDSTLSVNHALRHEPRKSPSVDKNGDPDGTGMGMGWFPGYAINVETGERLNIMFAENSSDTANNGADMLFNPTDDEANWGGCHFIYVCGSSGSTCNMPYRMTSCNRNFNYNGATVNVVGSQQGGVFVGSDGVEYPYFDCGAYDEGAWLREKFATVTNISNVNDNARKLMKMQIFNNVMWTSIAMPAAGETAQWLSTQATINIRVARPFMYYSSAVGDGPSSPVNDNAPTYSFNMRHLEPLAHIPSNFVGDKYDENIIDVNNIEAYISPTGDHFYLPEREYVSGLAHFYVPKESKLSTYYSQTLWVGGLDESEQPHVAAERYRQNNQNFWPGPLSLLDASEDEQTMIDWDRCFQITREEVLDFMNNFMAPNYTIPRHILEWPAHGDTTKGQAYNLAPYVDVDNDNHYDPSHGDYPYFLGDKALFFIFNDNYAAHPNGGSSIGLEVHGMAYAFDAPDDSLLNNTLFFNYKLFNRSPNSLHNTYVGLWSDWDLGDPRDNYVGCDVSRSTVYCYNGSPVDASYGDNPPMQTLTVLAGPTLPADLEDNPAYTDTADCSQFVNHTLNQYAINGFNFGNGIVDDERLGLTGFIYHENNSSVCGNPESAEQYYAYLTNRWLDNTHVKFGGNGHQSNGSSDLDCRFMFCGNSDPCRWNTNGMEPDTAFQYGPEGWTDESVGNAPYLRRGLAIVGPFGFDAGAMQEIDFCISTIFPSFVDSNSRSDHSLLSLVDQMRDNYKDGYYSESFREPDIYTLEETICEGDSYEFYGQQLTEPGTYTHLVRNDVGTIINAAYVLELSVVPVVQVTYAPICPGTAYVDDYFNVTVDMTATPGVQIYHTDITSPNGCPSIMVLYLDVRTDAGVEEHALIKNLKLYPNPTTGFVAMNVEDESLLNGNEVVSVYDLYGQLLQSFLLTNETTSINLSEYADGVYIVKVGHYIGKVVKK